MTPTTALTEALLDLLATDPLTLSPAGGAELKVKLVASALTPSRNLVPADVTLATFTGSTPLTVVAGDQEVGYDPERDQWFLQIVVPAGGWYWECTVAPGAPERIYGVILTNFGGTVIYGSQLRGTSVLIQSVGDSVDFPNLRFYLDDFVAAA